MKTIKFKTADELVKYCTQNNIIVAQVWVDHNPYNKGERALLWFHMPDAWITTHLNHKINDIDYSYDTEWHDEYKGSFELVLQFDQFTKPEVYQVGDVVEVLESAKDCGTYEEWEEIRRNMVGKKYRISKTHDDRSGVSYSLYNDVEETCYSFPHYSLKKIKNPIKEMTIQEIEEKLGYKIKIKTQ